MVNANTTIAIIPCKKFNWTAQIQLKESLFTRDEAISYASEHGCNLIVKYEKRSGPLFDALYDPDLNGTSEVNCDFVETVPVMIEPESHGWIKLMFRGVTGVAKRLGAAASASQREKAMPSVPSQALAVK